VAASKIGCPTVTRVIPLKEQTLVDND
jgi:hypothetical protein